MVVFRTAPQVGVQASAGGEGAVVASPGPRPSAQQGSLVPGPGLVRTRAGSIEFLVQPDRVRSGVAGVSNAVPLGVPLIGVRDCGAVVARVAHAVTIGVGLVVVPDGRAIVAGVTDAVAVRVQLVRVGEGRAVVGRVRHAVVVKVGIACVAQAIPVRVLLVGIGYGRAVIARITLSVAVRIQLIRVGDGRAIVGRVRHAVLVGVGTTRIRCQIPALKDLLGNLPAKRIQHGRSARVYGHGGDDRVGNGQQGVGCRQERLLLGRRRALADGRHNRLELREVLVVFQAVADVFEADGRERSVRSRAHQAAIAVGPAVAFGVIVRPGIPRGVWTGGNRSVVPLQWPVQHAVVEKTAELILEWDRPPAADGLRSRDTRCASWHTDDGDPRPRIPTYPCPLPAGCGPLPS